MSNWDKLTILDFLKRYASEAPAGRVIDLADDFEEIDRELFELKEAVAILAEGVVGLDEHGDISPDLKSKRPAVQWALRKVQYCHGWVKCGPTSDSINKLMEKIEHEIKCGNKRL